MDKSTLDTNPVSISDSISDSIPDDENSADHAPYTENLDLDQYDRKDRAPLLRFIARGIVDGPDDLPFDKPAIDEDRPACKTALSRKLVWHRKQALKQCLTLIPNQMIVNV